MKYLKEGQELFPDLKVLDEIIFELLNVFDAREIYHHSHGNGNEMFEYQYKSSDSHNEAWGIFFLGQVVASGDIHGFFDYDECQEKDYIKVTRENKDIIYRMAYDGVINQFKTLFTYLRYAEIQDNDRQALMDILDPNKN